MKLNFSILNNIAQKYGNTFYLLDINKFTENYNNLLSQFKKYYPNTKIAYSYKTNYIPRLCKIINDLGGYAEVVSDMEYKLAKKIGVKPEKIILNGPYQEYYAVKELLLGGGVVNIDSSAEIPMIKKIAEENKNTLLNVGVRCNFSINDGVISRFGVDTSSDDFYNILNFIKSKNNIKLKSLHIHFASRGIEAWENKVNGMLGLLDNKIDFIPQQIDLGGGFYGYMPESLKKQFGVYIPEFCDYAVKVAKKAATYFANKDVTPELFIEPGSALAGDAMKFAARVFSIKHVGKKSIATLLGSMYNINPTLNKKNPPIEIFHFDKKSCREYNDLDFGGFTCIESDYLYKGYNGKLAVGDYVVFENVGSYSIVLKPPFILPNFAIVCYNEKTNETELIKKAETFDDIFHTYTF